MKSFKDILKYKMVQHDMGRLSIMYYMDDILMVVTDYERPKKTWTKKPIFPTSSWRFVSMTATNEVSYIQGLITIEDIRDWSNEIITSSHVVVV